MTTSLNQGTARIYPFPAGGRSALGGHPYEEKAVADPASSRVSEVAVGDAWYHEAAIQETKPVQDR